MKKHLFFLLFLLSPLFCIAQIYQYLGVENGMSNRRIYRILKDNKGYVWFLTHDGIDRFNGKDFKQYKLMDGEEEVNSTTNLNWLDIDTNGVLWQIGKKGRVFCYDKWHDSFRLVYKIPANETKEKATPVSYGFVDRNNTVWLCSEDVLHLYNSKTKKTTVVKNEIAQNITDVEQIDDTHYFIGTDTGIHLAQLNEKALQLSPVKEIDSVKVQTNEIYYHKPSNKVFIGTFLRGILVYDLNTRQLTPVSCGLTDISINRIKSLNNKEVLIATDGAGVYKINTDTYLSVPYIVADFNSNNAMNGNNITDLFIDNDQRIWMANYPIGITIRDNRYANYKWIKHSIGSKQSLVNDQVNAIIEDSDGDLWFATSNGVSLYRQKSNEWFSFLSASDNDHQNKNHSFISLCEVVPGKIWVGGYTSGVYEIDKQKRKVSFFTPALFGNAEIRPDKYIRALSKSADGKIWSGGYYNLKEFDYKNKTMRSFKGVGVITTILEKSPTQMWIGTANGLFLLERKSGKLEAIDLSVEACYIYSLLQTPNNKLYIGTNNAGLLIYDIVQKSLEHFHTDNSALISNNIYTVLWDGKRDLFFSTENGLCFFDPVNKTFQNWTKEQGLKTDHFNAASGILRKNGNILFGSTDGAIEFNKDMVLPVDHKYQMVFSDLSIFYQIVYPNDEGSPLTTDIDETETLRLKFKQNIFSLNVSSINFDYPSLILYSWKLEGFYDGWSRPSKENVIRFTNLSPGTYTLRVRAISSEDQHAVLEERSMEIIIEQPIWLSFWALLFYLFLFLSIGVVVLRVMIMGKQRKVSDEKIRFFINTAHDIRTPLTLIKAPLEEIIEREKLSDKGQSNLNTALRNVNALIRLTTNLINFERADMYSGNLYISEYEVVAYVEEIVNVFRPYADVKRVDMTYQSNARYLNTWLDKDKMDSILKNIISNALKYTPEGGSVQIVLTETEDSWSIEVKDTGIGIPASEQKKLFKIHFRGTNAINSKITGSGIGLLLVWKLVRLHKGKLNFSSTEGKGSLIKITFPKKGKAYEKAVRRPLVNEQIAYPTTGVPASTPLIYKENEKTILANSTPDKRQKILIVEDNDDLREYLRRTLCEEFNIQTCSNGKSALTIVKEYLPNLIISDIMMPEMRGDELCQVLKNDINTSHIPIILLTALNDDKNIIEGLQTGADEYIVKPFNIGILRATITNLLTNRALLRHKYGNLELNDEENNTECINCSTDLDWKFIATVKQGVEDNIDNSNFNVDVLCTLLNMSRTSFYNKIKALTDQAPADYVRLIRLNRAAQLLKEQKYSITEVSEMTGFSDAKYFREVFKKHFNSSPSQYAKDHTTQT